MSRLARERRRRARRSAGPVFLILGVLAAVLAHRRARRRSGTSSGSPSTRARARRAQAGRPGRAPRSSTRPTARGWASSSPTSCARRSRAATSRRRSRTRRSRSRTSASTRHKGVDAEGVVRAAIKNIESGKTVEGGSTLTMQLVRTLYITKERTFKRKVHEAKLAEELENVHDKSVDPQQVPQQRPVRDRRRADRGRRPGRGARRSSTSPPRELELHEAALLAGLPQAPSHTTRSRARRARCAGATRCSTRWPSCG